MLETLKNEGIRITNAQKAFAERQGHVHILFKTPLKSIKQKSVFWLSAHIQ